MKLKLVDNISPLSLTAIEFLREQLPGQAFTGHDVSESSGLSQIGDMLKGMLDGVTGAFKNPVKFLRQRSLAQTVEVNKCFVRLNDPDGIKYGGGYRVKSIRLKDNWKQMNSNQLYTSEYGQEYDYTTKEIFNGQERIISSGVASYEPSLGGDENPFQTMLQVANKVPLGPASYGAIEMPVLDAFFPAASVGYSKVTVRSIKKGQQDPTKKSRSGIGKQVSEFYTAKDFPVYYSNTGFDPGTDREASTSYGIFFYKYAFDSRALSQGFLVETNDMHGKMRSQASYPENDDKTPLNYTQNFYRNTGSKGFNEKFDFVYASQGGTISQGNMGIDIELMTDTREFSVKSKSLEIQAQVDLFPVIYPFWLPFIWPVGGASENTYRAVTTTKVITYHSILDSVVVVEKGSQVSTKNLVYDSETGDVIVNKTNNEFKKPIYSTSYPAWWAYSGMAPAYKNIDAVYTGVNFRDGKIISGNVPNAVLESGDELYLTNQGISPTDACASQVLNLETAVKLWCFDKNKNTGSLTNIAPDYYFMDKNGKLYSKNGVNFKIVRSGKRNMLSATAGSVVSMATPVVNNKLKIDNNSKALNATAVEYKEKWQTDNDVFKRYKTVPSGGDTSTANLIFNGDFNLGNVGFTSEFWWYPNCDFPCFKCYNICNAGGIYGNVMGFNGFSLIAWQQTVPVFSNRDYTFSASFYNVNNAMATIQIYINDIPISNAFDLQPIGWQTFSFPWNSGNATSAVIKIRDHNGNENGNDFALDKISLTKSNCGLPDLEVPDCAGYLEKNINPYVKGLLGTFRTYQSKVFYGSRIETDPMTITNISSNGYLDNFKLYWDFNASNNLVPDLANNKWVFNSQITRVNSRGLELETKDALDIYTAAQYGFNKTMPLAISSNSRYSEMFNEGFEDKDYNETLNSAAINPCLRKHIDLMSLTNSNVLNTDALGFNAHTGKYVLAVNANQTATKTIDVKNPGTDNFDLLPIADSKTFSNTTYSGNYFQYGLPSSSIKYEYCNGVINTELFSNIPRIYERPINNYIGTTCETDPIRHIAIGSFEGDQNGYSGCSSNITGTYPNDGPTYIKHMYFLAPVSATYNFTTNIRSNSGKFQVIIRAADNSTGSHNFTTFSGIPYTPNYQYLTSVWYDAGSPHISCVTNFFDPMINVPINVSMCANQYYEFLVIYTPNSWKWSECSGTQFNYPCPHNQRITINYFQSGSFYSTRTVLNSTTCNFIKPIPATNEMLNPTFSVQPGKRMLFSTWVRENCATPCTVQTYANSKVTLTFNTGSPVTLLPSGPIIEGWQKIEGEFTPPAGATSMTIGFVNSSPSQPVYFDDVRIHPYNANMKSFVYDPVNLRLVAQMDANNYASFYEYDEEGTLIRTKAETREGIKTITETRSAKQKNITTIQE
ncbi:MAG: hypothetical protein ABIN74_14670 [Ferruginibacter sp.]